MNDSEAVPVVFIDASSPDAGKAEPARQRSPETRGEPYLGKSKRGLSSGDAQRKKAAAEILRARAELVGPNDPTGARWDRRDADRLDREAEAILTLPVPPEIGAGGELVPSLEANKIGLTCTVENPTHTTAQASLNRLELIADAGCLDTGVDAAETIQAKNSLEKMLAHQLAAVHSLGMHFISKARNHIQGASNCRFVNQKPGIHDIEAARAANAATRCFDSYQQGLLTLAQMRRGGRQTLTVQYVAVGPGGQAVVAGKMRTGGKRKGKAK